MTIEGTKYLGSWGKMIPVNDTQHITQTNISSDDGKGVHITQNISGTPSKVQDRFDSQGNYLGSNFAKR